VHQIGGFDSEAVRAEFALDQALTPVVVLAVGRAFHDAVRQTRTGGHLFVSLDAAVKLASPSCSTNFMPGTCLTADKSAVQRPLRCFGTPQVTDRAVTTRKHLVRMIDTWKRGGS
jgi:hypothetical protein